MLSRLLTPCSFTCALVWKGEEGVLLKEAVHYFWPCIFSQLTWEQSSAEQATTRGSPRRHSPLGTSLYHLHLLYQGHAKRNPRCRFWTPTRLIIVSFFVACRANKTSQKGNSSLVNEGKRKLQWKEQRAWLYWVSPIFSYLFLKHVARPLSHHSVNTSLHEDSGQLLSQSIPVS